MPAGVASETCEPLEPLVTGSVSCLTSVPMPGGSSRLASGRRFADGDAGNEARTGPTGTDVDGRGRFSRGGHHVLPRPHTSSG
jgi:hypothetical protein